MDLTPHPVALHEPLASAPTAAPTGALLTESSETVRTLSQNGFDAIYGDHSTIALDAFNADVAARGPHAALDQLADRPGAYGPGVEPSTLSRALAGSLRLSLPEGDARTDPRSGDPAVDDPPARDVNGISSRTPFPKEVGQTETQESVLRRSFQEYASRAGISNERLDPDLPSPREQFVTDRTMANREANGGEVRIFNATTGLAYTAEQWAARQQAGTITMYPTDDDIESLEASLQHTRQDQGTRLAREVLAALDANESLSAARLLGVTDPEARLANAIEQLSRRQGDLDFQRGFVHGLQADGFIQLSRTFADHTTYSRVLAQSLREAVTEREDVVVVNESDDGPSTIAVAIAQRADSETLARLVARPDHGLGTEFLVEAAKGVTVDPKDYGRSRDDVLTRAAQDPQAALQLLGDADFVRTVAVRHTNRFDVDTQSKALSQFVTSGLSAQMRDADPAQVANALRTVMEVLAENGGTIQTPASGMVEPGSYPTVNEPLAIALSKAYVANTGVMADASVMPGKSDGQADGTDVRALIAALQPYQDVQDPQTGQTLGDQVLAATAVEYTRLLNRAAETGNAADAAKAGKLAGAVLDGASQANLTAGRSADAQQAKLNQYISIASGVLTGGVAKADGRVIADVVAKASNAELGSAMKSSNATRAEAENDAGFSQQLNTNSVSVLSAVERASNGALRESDQSQQFVRDLRTYDAALPDGEKILDGNGRLIRSTDATAAQLAHMIRLANNTLPVGARADKDLVDATNRVSEAIQTMLNAVDSATTTQVKR